MIGVSLCQAIERVPPVRSNEKAGLVKSLLAGVVIPTPSIDHFGRPIQKQDSMIVYLASGCVGCSNDTDVLTQSFGQQVLIVIPDSPKALKLSQTSIKSHFRVVFDKDHSLFPSELYRLSPILMQTRNDRVIRGAQAVLSGPQIIDSLLQGTEL